MGVFAATSHTIRATAVIVSGTFSCSILIYLTRNNYFPPFENAGAQSTEQNDTIEEMAIETPWRRTFPNSEFGYARNETAIETSWRLGHDNSTHTHFITILFTPGI